MNLSKTQWTLIATIVIAVGNALVPFLSAQVAGTVTAILGLIAYAFHVSDTNQAVASTKAPSQPTQ